MIKHLVFQYEIVIAADANFTRLYCCMSYTIFKAIGARQLRWSRSHSMAFYQIMWSQTGWANLGWMPGDYLRSSIPSFLNCTGEKEPNKRLTAQDRGQGEIIHHHKQNILNTGKLPGFIINQIREG